MQGWEDGYRKGLNSSIGVVPICPVPPVGKDTYQDGFGLGYSKANNKSNNDSKGNLPDPVPTPDYTKSLKCQGID